MSFDEEFLIGPKKYQKKFDVLSQFASSFLGDISQCGFLQIQNSGELLCATNNIDFVENYLDKEAYKLDPALVANNNISEGYHLWAAHPGLRILFGEKGVVSGQTETKHGFTYSKKISDDIFCHYFFNSTNFEIYDKFANNLAMVERFLKYFATEMEVIADELKSKEAYINILDKKKQVFYNQTFRASNKPTKEQFIDFLHSAGILTKHIKLTDREIQCCEFYLQGRTAHKIGDILGISRRTVEGHLESLKHKLSCSSRDDLLQRVNLVN